MQSAFIHVSSSIICNAYGVPYMASLKLGELLKGQRNYRALLHTLLGY